MWWSYYAVLVILYLGLRMFIFITCSAFKELGQQCTRAREQARKGEKELLAGTWRVAPLARLILRHFRLFMAGVS